MNWEVLIAKLVTAYKVINDQNTIIGRLGFAILISDKSNLKMILYKSKIDLLSSVVLREANKIFVKGNFIQYLDSNNNFWSILFENESDRDETIRLVEERCTIERIEIDSSIKANDGNGSINEMESENQEKNAKNDEDATCADKSVETDPEEKQNKQLKTNILARMAKMGKRLVPSGSSKNSASDESASENSPENSPKRQPVIMRKPNNSTATSSPILQVAKLHPSPHIPHTVEFRQNNNSNNISAASSDSSLNLMMMQNTEIRFNLSKLDSKLDRLCDKIEVLSTASNSSISNSNSRSVNVQNSTDELNELKVQIKALTQENKEYKKHIIELSEKNDVIQLLEAKLKHALEAYEHAEVQMKTKDADLGELRSQLNCSKRLAEDLQESLSSIRESQKNITFTTKEAQTTPDTPKTSELYLQENHVKEMMNSLYFKLCERISNLHDLKQSEILKIIGQVIKQETQEILRKNVSS